MAGNNSEIRTLLFQQGVTVAVPPTSSDQQNKVALVNNSNNSLNAFRYSYLTTATVIISYTIYRKITGGYRSMTGQLRMVAQPDGATSTLKWVLEELERVERGGDSGVNFGLDVIDSSQQQLRVTLDNMAGSVCTMYYRITTMSA